MSHRAARATWPLEFPRRFTIERKRKDGTTYTAQVKGSSVKWVLMCLAWHANENDLTWPSSTTIARETGLERKTVLDCLPILRSITGLLKLTGVEKKRTPVYKLLITTVVIKGDSCPVYEISCSENGTLQSAENGTQNQQITYKETDGRAAFRGSARRPSGAIPIEALDKLKKMGYLTTIRSLTPDESSGSPQT